MRRCLRCGRRIWPWQHYALMVIGPGREYRWHASHQQPRPSDRRVHLTPVDAIALAEREGGTIVGYVNPDGSGEGDWSAYAGLGPLEQRYLDGDR